MNPEKWQEPTLRETILIMDQWELLTGKPVNLTAKRGRVRPVFANTEEVVIIE